MKLTIVEKNLPSWTAMHIDFVMCKKLRSGGVPRANDSVTIRQV